MNKVYEKSPFVEPARRVTLAAAPSVQKRWHVPSIGILKCVFADAEDEIITYKTRVYFRWEFSSPHVKGNSTKTMSVSSFCA